MSAKYRKAKRRGLRANKVSLKSGERRAQGATIDFIVAFIVFLTIFIINYYSWNSVEVKIMNTEDNHYFQTDVYNSVDSLLRNTGEPVNWDKNTSSVVSIGLAGKTNILSNEKLMALNNTSYETLKDYVLSTGDYQIIIKDGDGNIIYQTGTEPKGLIIVVNRIVMINNSYYTFTFKGWRE